MDVVRVCWEVQPWSIGVLECWGKALDRDVFLFLLFSITPILHCLGTPVMSKAK
jgi:hypothetical protein